MIWIVTGLIVVGVLLTAFFAGAETGLYRAARLRLMLDAMGGSWSARGLLWLANQPSLFVATMLVGTNVASYLVSLAAVLANGHGSESYWAEMATTLALTPVLFVYGELVPKSYFLEAPNRLLRRAGPLVLVCTVIFLPVSGLLWGLNRLLARWLGQSNQPPRASLARRELRRLVEEGQEAGILHPAQQALAQGVFAIANRPLHEFLAPTAAVPRARAGTPRDEIISMARRLEASVVVVEQVGESRPLVGYYRVLELMVRADEPMPAPSPLMLLDHDESHLAAIMTLCGAKEELAEVVDGDGRFVGLVTVERLLEPLFASR